MDTQNSVRKQIIDIMSEDLGLPYESAKDFINELVDSEDSLEQIREIAANLLQDIILNNK